MDMTAITPMHYVAVALAVAVVSFHAYEAAVCKPGATPASKQKCLNVNMSPMNPAPLGRVRILVMALALVVIPYILARTFERSTMAITAVASLVLCMTYTVISGCYPTKNTKNTSLLCRANLGNLIASVSCYFIVGLFLSAYIKIANSNN